MASTHIKLFAASACIAMLTACASDGTDIGGRSISISDPEEISPIDASTNLPVFYKADEIRITRKKINNGHQYIETYYQKGHSTRKLAVTESLPGRGQYSLRTVKTITSKETFRDRFLAPEGHRVTEIKDDAVGVYADWGGQCRITMGKMLSNRTRTPDGRPNAILYLNSCKLLDAEVTKIVKQFDGMTPSDRARIAADLEN